METKEEFCSACVMGVAALAGVGTAGASSKVNKKRKKIVFWVGISITLISILIIIILMIKGCANCA